MMLNLEQNKSGVASFETREDIGVLTIENGSQNKISQADFLDINDLKAWLSSQALKGLIIMGKGRHFSSGADVDNIRANRDNVNYLRESLKKGKDILNYIEALPIVTVAAISGICFGAGLEIALSCQFRIGTANAVLAFPESNLGIMPGLAGTVRLPGKIDKTKALEMIISGRTVTAEEAYEMGLIDKMVPNKTHLDGALQFINTLTQNKSPQQISNIIRAVNHSGSETAATAMEYEGEMFLEMVKDL